MMIIFFAIAAVVIVALFLLKKSNEGAYPLFDGKILLKARLRNALPREETALGNKLLSARLWLLEKKLQLLSPFMPLGRTSVKLSRAPVRRASYPRAAGFELYHQSGFLRAFHTINLSLAGIITLLLLVYSLTGFSAKKAHSRAQFPPSDNLHGNPPGEKMKNHLAALPGDCPAVLHASDCPLQFTGARASRGADKLIASLVAPSAHPFKSKGGASHTNTSGSHSNTPGSPHTDVFTAHSNTPSHQNHSNTHWNGAPNGQDHVNLDTRPYKV